jgi:lipid-binding SYLF domain-containing protein
MRAEAMPAFEKAYPGVTKRAEQASGYAVFSNFGLKIFVIGSGNGYGIVRDDATRKDIYMRMGELNFGLGIGAKDFRALFVFNNPTVMRKFVNEGWEFGGDAEVGAKGKGEGGELGKSASVNDIDVYQITRNGATIQATVGGTKYWKDKELNE